MWTYRTMTRLKVSLNLVLPFFNTKIYIFSLSFLQCSIIIPRGSIIRQVVTAFTVIRCALTVTQFLLPSVQRVTSPSLNVYSPLKPPPDHYLHSQIVINIFIYIHIYMYGTGNSPRPSSLWCFVTLVDRVQNRRFMVRGEVKRRTVLSTKVLTSSPMPYSDLEEHHGLIFLHEFLITPYRFPVVGLVPV